MLRQNFETERVGERCGAACAHGAVARASSKTVHARPRPEAASRRRNAGVLVLGCSPPVATATAERRRAKAKPTLWRLAGWRFGLAKLLSPHRSTSVDGVTADGLMPPASALPSSHTHNPPVPCTWTPSRPSPPPINNPSPFAARYTSTRAEQQPAEQPKKLTNARARRLQPPVPSSSRKPSSASARSESIPSKSNRFRWRHPSPSAPRRRPGRRARTRRRASVL
jgi:hypothetical protein